LPLFSLKGLMETIHVKARLRGRLRQFANTGVPNHWEGEVPVGITVGELICVIGGKREDVHYFRMNEKYCYETEVLSNGAFVQYYPPAQ